MLTDNPEIVMLNIPEDVRERFDFLPEQHSVPEKYRPYYRKWLRCYLDFCRKYNLPEGEPSGRRRFIEKPAEKQQPEPYRKQASHAVSIYHQLLQNRPEQSKPAPSDEDHHPSPSRLPADNEQTRANGENSGNEQTRANGENSGWDSAVQENVSASTQNWAFNALLLFYRHVLKKEPGEIRSVRAKRKPYIPVVLSREEVRSIIRNLPYPYEPKG